MSHLASPPYCCRLSSLLARSKDYEAGQMALTQRIVDARKLLKQGEVNYDFRVKISQICSDLNVDGIRGDIVTNRAAKALAAFEGRTEVSRAILQREGWRKGDNGWGSRGARWMHTARGWLCMPAWTRARTPDLPVFQLAMPYYDLQLTILMLDLPRSGDPRGHLPCHSPVPAPPPPERPPG